MKASHQVIGILLDSLGKDGDRMVFEKYSKRYSDDIPIQRLIKRFLSDPDKKDLKAVEKGLEDLRKTRQLEATGGGDLALSDRRRLRKSD